MFLAVRGLQLQLQLGQRWGTRLFQNSAAVWQKQKPGKTGGGNAKKSNQPKEVILSWQISKNDLESQKKKSIESILAKGSKLQVRLENRNKKGYHVPNDNELEARQILLNRVEELVTAAGGMKAKPPQGNVKTRMMLFFASKTQSSQ